MIDQNSGARVLSTLDSRVSCVVGGKERRDSGENATHTTRRDSAHTFGIDNRPQQCRKGVHNCSEWPQPHHKPAARVRKITLSGLKGGSRGF